MLQVLPQRLIPVIHIEAGLRSFNMAMPEEQNRILTDHISSVLFCPTDTAVENLKKEDLTSNVYQVGDVMCDAVRHYSQKMECMLKESFMRELRFLYKEQDVADRWYLVTMHRAENTQNIETIQEVLSALEELDAQVIFPVHPRIRKYIDILQQKRVYKNICFVEPLGYLAMLYFTKGAVKVITDSGGLQKEAYMLGTNVVTLRDQTEWVETLKGNHNVLCNIIKADILKAIYEADIQDAFDDNIFGDGKAAKKICDILKSLS